MVLLHISSAVVHPAVLYSLLHWQYRVHLLSKHPKPSSRHYWKTSQVKQAGNRVSTMKEAELPAHGILHMHKFCRLKWENVATNKVTLILHWNFSSLPSGNYTPTPPPHPPSTNSGLYSLSASQTVPLSILEPTCTGARESCIRWNTGGISDIRWLGVGFFGWFGGGVLWDCVCLGFGFLF